MYEVTNTETSQLEIRKARTRTHIVVGSLDFTTRSKKLVDPDTLNTITQALERLGILRKTEDRGSTIEYSLAGIKVGDRTIPGNYIALAAFLLFYAPRNRKVIEKLKALVLEKPQILVEAAKLLQERYPMLNILQDAKTFKEAAKLVYNTVAKPEIGSERRSRLAGLIIEYIRAKGYDVNPPRTFDRYKDFYAWLAEQINNDIRLLKENPDALPENVRNVVADILSRVKSDGITVSSVRSAWNKARKDNREVVLSIEKSFGLPAYWALSPEERRAIRSAMAAERLRQYARMRSVAKQERIEKTKQVLRDLLAKLRSGEIPPDILNRISSRIGLAEYVSQQLYNMGVSGRNGPLSPRTVSKYFNYDEEMERLYKEIQLLVSERLRQYRGAQAQPQPAVQEYRPTTEAASFEEFFEEGGRAVPA